METKFLEEIRVAVEQSMEEFLQQAPLTQGQLFVIGCSTSEVMGKRIGSDWNNQVALTIYQALNHFQGRDGFQLAFQCCEHLNRAVVVERAVAVERRWDPVTAIPVPGAGGSMAAMAYLQMEDPVLVAQVQADAGMDIGDTLIGMHLRPVAVPVRVATKAIGSAHLTMAKTRPPLIGGVRTVYSKAEAKKRMEEEDYGACN